MRADLAFLRGEQPLVLVEAKGRPLPDRLANGMVSRLLNLAARTTARWLVISDPQAIRVYPITREGNPPGRVTTIPIAAVRETINLTEAEGVWGDRALLFATELWLRLLASDKNAFPDQAELRLLAEDLGATEPVFEYDTDKLDTG